jgi:signal transduction histidine kinase
MESLPAVLAEPAVLEQVFANLLSNAVKFRQRGDAARVRVWAEAKGDCVRFWVEDQGIGIAAEHQGRIFGAFERLHGQETYPGSGMGLTIVKTGIERLGGSAGVVSQPGEGARFWVELSAADRSRSQENQIVRI